MLSKDILLTKEEIDFKEFEKCSLTSHTVDLMVITKITDVDKNFVKNLKSEGYSTKYPLVIIPGFASSSLEITESKDCPFWVNERAWISIKRLGNEKVIRMVDNYKKMVNKIGQFSINSFDEEEYFSLWIKHLELNPENGYEDNKGIKVRPVQGRFFNIYKSANQKINISRI